MIWLLFVAFIIIPLYTILRACQGAGGNKCKKSVRPKSLLVLDL